MVDESGGTVPMTPQLQEALLERVTAMASRGLRTLCLSYRGAWAGARARCRGHLPPRRPAGRLRQALGWWAGGHRRGGRAGGP